MARTPEEWLPILAKRLDDRRTRIDVLRSYANGDAPLPEMGRTVRESWVRFQKTARANLGGLAVEAPANRMVPNGVQVGQANQDDDRVRAIWRRNRLDVAIPDVIRDVLTTSFGYIVVGRDAFGLAVVTAEQPEFMYASTDPLQPWVSRAAIKVWRDVDAALDYAYVWVPGLRQRFARPASDEKTKRAWERASDGEWFPDGEPESFTGPIPVFALENHGGTGEFEEHTDLIDRINLGILQRLSTVSMQAFRQRALKGGLPATDENDNPIDYAATFQPAPGALWDLPEGIDVWESQDSSQGIRAMLESVKDDLREFSGTLSVPLGPMLQDAANQSAEGAAYNKEGLIFKVRDRIARFTPPLEAALETALRIEYPDVADNVTLLWMPPEHVSLQEKYAAATQAKATGVPWRTIMTTILGYSAEQVDRMEVERAAEQLQLATLFPQQQPPAENPGAVNVDGD
jgi:hypothetical protein